jgi:ABC-type multidrug transport system ATPase subunit
MRQLPIAARGLDKVFGFAPVLRGVNLRVEPGAGLLIAGGNGAGKSTLIAILAGLSAPSAGVATLFGTDSRHLAPATQEPSVGNVAINSRKVTMQ